MNQKEKKEFTAERNKKICEDVKSGMSYNEISEKYGLEKSTIVNIAWVAGINKRSEREPINRDELIADLNSGMFQKKVMEKYHIGRVKMLEIANGESKSPEEEEHLNLAHHVINTRHIFQNGKRYKDVTERFTKAQEIAADHTKLGIF